MQSAFSEKRPLLPTASPEASPAAPTRAQRCRGLLLPAAVFLTVSYLVLLGGPIEPGVSPRSGLDGWIDAQERRSLAGVLANIGADGSHSGEEGAKAGIVIASPSTSAPNYLYTWTRDAALVSKALLDNMLASGNSSLAKTLDDYAVAQGVLQHVSNPSGTFAKGGLGEPKFNIDYTAFTENWGRPQRDGPALRATTLIGYANHLATSSASTSFISSTLIPIIEADLNYVQTYWNQTGFDLWEEVRGSSFFTTAVQHRALVEGAAFFASVGRPRPTYATTADSVLCFLQSYWNEEGQHVVSNVNAMESRSGLDGNSILASIHTFDSGSTTCDRDSFQPCSDRALVNHKAVVDSFREIYAINKGIPSSEAVAVGRYSEDVYYGGHPWYLITLAAAEQLYLALHTWEKNAELSITATSLPFFSQIYSPATVGTFTKKDSSAVFSEIIRAVRTYADGFFSVVEKYTPEDGSLAEQFDRATGAPLSASDLTWSYASFITAAAARRGEVPLSWKSDGRAPACAATQSPAAVLVTFDEVVETVYGETVFVVGSLPELGNWDPEAGRRLSADSYTAEKHLWTRAIYLPPSTAFEYKFIRRDADGRVRWESGPNRSSTTIFPGESQTLGAVWQ
ncbi:hypothetical protein RQP46_003926 [Phenoliferia psychrophenolica]